MFARERGELGIGVRLAAESVVNKDQSLHSAMPCLLHYLQGFITSAKRKQDDRQIVGRARIRGTELEYPTLRRFRFCQSFRPRVNPGENIVCPWMERVSHDRGMSLAHPSVPVSLVLIEPG